MEAVIVSRILNNMCSMFNFWGGMEKLTLVAVIFNLTPPTNDRYSAYLVNRFFPLLRE
jgi:hypothetical protein